MPQSAEGNWRLKCPGLPPVPFVPFVPFVFSPLGYRLLSLRHPEASGFEIEHLRSDGQTNGPTLALGFPICVYLCSSVVKLNCYGRV